MHEFKNGDLVRLIIREYPTDWYLSYSFENPAFGGTGGTARRCTPEDVAVVVYDDARLGHYVGIRNFEGYYRNHILEDLEHVDVQKG